MSKDLTEPVSQHGSETTKDGSVTASNLRNKLIAAENAIGAALISDRAGAHEETRFRIGLAQRLLATIVQEHSAPIEQLIKLKDDRIAQLTKAQAVAHSLLAPRKIDEPVNHQ